jgi:integrase/recombinase XerD
MSILTGSLAGTPSKPTRALSIAIRGKTIVAKTYLETHEVMMLEESATNQRDRLLIRLLFHLGCRVSELLTISVQDIDLIARTVTIQHLKLRTKLSCPDCGNRLNKNSTYCPSCGLKVAKVVAQEKEHRRMRMLPIDSDTMTVLQRYIERGGPVVRGGKRLLFGINRYRAWQIVKECAEKAGLPRLVNSETGRVHNVSPHKLRDAFAVNAVKFDDSGDGLRMLQEHLGHASFNTTARYRKISGEEHRDWYQKLWEKDKP